MYQIWKKGKKNNPSGLVLYPSYHMYTYLYANRLVNEVKLTGAFSVSEVHSWVSLCLPEVPEKYNSYNISL
jgi:hypothetical protein